MKLNVYEDALIDLIKEMKKSIAEVKALHAPEQPLIYSIGNQAFFYLK